MKFDLTKPYRQRCGREAKVTVTDLTGACVEGEERNG